MLATPHIVQGLPHAGLEVPELITLRGRVISCNLYGMNEPRH